MPVESDYTEAPNYFLKCKWPLDTTQDRSSWKHSSTAKPTHISKTCCLDREDLLVEVLPPQWPLKSFPNRRTLWRLFNQLHSFQTATPSLLPTQGKHERHLCINVNTFPIITEIKAFPLKPNVLNLVEYADAKMESPCQALQISG